MRSHEHAAIGALCSALAAALLARGRSLPTKLALWTYGLLLSVFIDLDHFVIARLKTGSWSYLTRAVRHPIWAFTEQESVFPDVRMKLERLTSHVLIGGALVLAFRPASRLLATFSAVVVYAHVLADLLREIEVA
ncbi:hypothetical protein [Halalkalicoccus jeotgali]|uniref:Membrane-bound metal-dependent hydrolase n=1 Tax=Halalkalicoccus jeotgali (strain DSM 18796 / CECT 7217 / JCM 14584 / KCTC 4019 / B3) TaxID=795797 RepID=D8J522_HALJB|nr:hypothetical protein [Halalkalicoccus jeotgali]ADJ13603.1 hypothetical protein HacjB3_01050 [Halalkalicoccus jeotgali B3]ELY33375.1 hypothetical protein C497_18282 [Halalkalicoccus jeotgali B3]